MRHARTHPHAHAHAHRYQQVVVLKAIGTHKRMYGLLQLTVLHMFCPGLYDQHMNRLIFGW